MAHESQANSCATAQRDIGMYLTREISHFLPFAPECALSCQSLEEPRKGDLGTLPVWTNAAIKCLRAIEELSL